MSREVHVRFWESVGVRLPCATRLPLYRQEGLFGRAGLAIPQSTLAQWVGQMGVQLQALVDALKEELLSFPVLHADETPVAMLDPGAGKTHRAYLWSYSIGAHDPVRAVIYDFADSRAGKHAQAFLGDWRGTLVCDDYSGMPSTWSTVNSGNSENLPKGISRQSTLIACTKFDYGVMPRRLRSLRASSLIKTIAKTLF